MHTYVCVFKMSALYAALKRPAHSLSPTFERFARRRSSHPFYKVALRWRTRPST